MSTFISSFFALFIVLPLLGYVVVFTISKTVTGVHRQSVNIAIDFTTFLLILAVHFLIRTIWGQSYLWLIMIILFTTAMIFSILHWKVRGEVVVGKVFKGFWRFNFLLFFTGYLGLIVFGLIQRAVAAVQLP
ncbi:hypothetical protein A8F94_11700 [Bacillus sp. FJAT-27225]|uniref:DUF3397 domain-containing protein n=1 Tax=Bacillus sp. FJAT-27225 TaxID=1743144 RepID=UPI00080C297D|nr:DUF3397 domain-containing protein [Bacillus sp. FJAT-27225]OCA85545.1 hypothetical protein A8F94_11700 [Bacillus sp. FJAT-27225]